jgi:hypothetical protein
VRHPTVSTWTGEWWCLGQDSIKTVPQCDR